MLLYVGIGGIFGAITRYLLGKWITRTTRSLFPFGTLIINISGSFILGVLAALHTDHVLPEWLWLLLGVGFMGAYTTFSTFGYETIQMLKTRDTRNAVLYVALSVILGIVFAWIGSILVD